jgi:hypothetical protein
MEGADPGSRAPSGLIAVVTTTNKATLGREERLGFHEETCLPIRCFLVQSFVIQTLPIRIAATWPLLDATTGQENLAHCGCPHGAVAIFGEKDTSSRRPQLNGERGAEVSSPTEACIICMLRLRTNRTRPVVFHRSMMCVFAQSRQSQKNLLRKDLTGNPSPSVCS